MARNKSIRFMDNQFARTGNTTFSSEQGTFPFSNALNDRRSKYWSPNNTFIIDDTNNKIYINSGAIIATVTNGTYTGTTLAAEIQTQLNSVSVNWTCTYSTSTWRFTLDNPSTLGIAFQLTTNAIWDTLGFSASVEIAVGAAFDPAISDFPVIHSEEFIKVDNGVPLEVTFVGLIGPLDEVFTISKNATVTIEANNIDDFTSPPFTTTATVTDGGILEFIDTDGGDTTYRYWKLKIQDRSNATIGGTGFKFGYFYLGDAKTFTTTNVAKGFGKKLNDPSKTLTSENGQEFFQLKTKFHTYDSMSIELMEHGENIEMQEMFNRLGIATPFFFSLDPTQCISSTADENTKYVRFDREPALKQQHLNYYSLSMSLKEVL